MTMLEIRFRYGKRSWTGTLTTGIMWFVTALNGVAAAILISQFIKENKILQYFGRISLIVLCIHGPVYVITMSAGCRHTVIAETELKLIEVQLGKEIDVNDKQKFELEY